MRHVLRKKCTNVLSFQASAAKPNSFQLTFQSSIGTCINLLVRGDFEHLLLAVSTNKVLFEVFFSIFTTQKTLNLYAV